MTFPYLAAIFVIGYGFALYLGYRYGRRAERDNQRRAGSCLYSFRKEQERTEAGMN